MADSQALPLAVATFQTCQFIGRPECGVSSQIYENFKMLELVIRANELEIILISFQINLAHCVTYLARAPKSYESTRALWRVKECITNNEGPQPAVPLHLRNASTKLMKNLGMQYIHNLSPRFFYVNWPKLNERYLLTVIVLQVHHECSVHS